MICPQSELTYNQWKDDKAASDAELTTLKGTVGEMEELFDLVQFILWVVAMVMWPQLFSRFLHCHLPFGDFFGVFVWACLCVYRGICMWGNIPGSFRMYLVSSFTHKYVLLIWIPAFLVQAYLLVFSVWTAVWVILLKDAKFFVFLRETPLKLKVHHRLWSSWVGQVYHSNFNSKARGVAILINKIIKFSSTDVIADKNGRYLIIAGTLMQTEVLLVNVNAPNFD